MTTFENQSKQSSLTVRLFELIKSLSADEQKRLLRDRKDSKISGEIVRTSPHGISVRFKTTDHQQDEMINSLMKMI
jgi:hypothetical protein